MCVPRRTRIQLVGKLAARQIEKLADMDKEIERALARYRRDQAAAKRRERAARSSESK